MIRSGPAQISLLDTKQVPGCARDLAREKEYYRRYRVCRPHAVATKVTVLEWHATTSPFDHL